MSSNFRRIAPYVLLYAVAGVLVSYVLGWVLRPALLRFVPQLGAKMQPSVLAFYAMAALTVAGAAGTALSRNIIYSGFSLIAAFFGVGGLYVFLSADFLAVTQLLIYVGGILVLILFAIMLTSGIGSINVSNQSVGMPLAGAIASATAGLLVYVAAAGPWAVRAELGPLEATTARIGNALLQQYLLPFEIASVVLLASLVGAVVIVRKEIRPDEAPSGE